MRNEITPFVLTRNEAPNIGRTLTRLAWAPEVVVLDSESTDETERIARSFPNVRFLTRRFDTHARQCNFAHEDAGIETPWVLSLDADYVLEEALVDEILALDPPPTVAGYRAAFVYAIGGRQLRRALYPPRTVLYRRDRARYVQEGHTQRLVLDGPAAPLRGRIVHDDRKPFRSWLASQRRYARLEAERLKATPWRLLRWGDRARLLRVVTPWAVPLTCLLAHGLVLDGLPGLVYAGQRAIAETLIAASLTGRRTGVPP